MILAGDIGGTKARIGLFDRRGGKAELVVSDQYTSKDFATLESLLEAFLSEHSGAMKGAIEAACFGLPGPVINGRVRVTNLPWEVAQVDVALSERPRQHGGGDTNARPLQPHNSV